MPGIVISYHRECFLTETAVSAKDGARAPSYAALLVHGCFTICQTDRLPISGNTRRNWNDIVPLILDL